MNTKHFHLKVLLGSALILSLLAGSDQAGKSACCYFAAQDKDINQPGQKAFIKWNPAEKVEAFTVQAKFEGNAVDFGMVIPTPARPKLDEMPRDFFKDLAIYTILMPLPQAIYADLEPMPVPCSAPTMKGAMFGAVPPSVRRKSSVVVLESGVVGSLDYKIIVADDATGLFNWLKSNKYSYAGDEATLRFYIDKKWFFTVMKIDPKQMKKASDGSYVGEVTPTRFTFNSDKCIYPLKITQLSVKDKTDALFYVQAPKEMDLQGDWSWMHSYRPMWLTYMLGCSADQQQQSELMSRQQWLNNKKAKDHGFETSKLEWAKLLGQQEMSVLDDPLKNYGQMGTGDLAPGSKVIGLNEFLDECKANYLKKHKTMTEYAKDQLARMSDQYQASAGMIVKNPASAIGKGFIYTPYSWYPARHAPLDEVKNLTRLKGHLQNGQWLTKFRRVMRKEEMNQDIILSEVPKEKEQTYVRIMPTSPP